MDFKDIDNEIEAWKNLTKPLDKLLEEHKEFEQFGIFLNKNETPTINKYPGGRVRLPIEHTIEKQLKILGLDEISVRQDFCTLCFIVTCVIDNRRVSITISQERLQAMNYLNEENLIYYIYEKLIGN